MLVLEDGWLVLTRLRQNAKVSVAAKCMCVCVCVCLHLRHKLLHKLKSASPHPFTGEQDITSPVCIAFTFLGSGKHVFHFFFCIISFYFSSAFHIPSKLFTSSCIYNDGYTWNFVEVL